MKKTAVILVAVLLVVASAISGVFALYSTTIEDANSNTTTAKHFYVGAETVADFAADVEIAPSETLTSTFSVTNKDTVSVSEVDIQVTMTVELNSEITPLTIEITAPDNVNMVKNGNVYSFTMAKDVEFNETFTVTLSWPTGDTSGSDNAFIDKTAGYTINIVGTQLVA